MKRRSRQYNLVEVILALGVMAIGVVSVMALFPVGAAATRDAAMETFAANAADEVCHMVEFLAKEDRNTWSTWIQGNTYIPNGKPNAPAENTATTNPAHWQPLPSRIRGIDSNIFRHSTSGVFLLISHHDTGVNITNGLQDINADKIDYKAVVQIWKERVREDPTGASTDLQYTEAARLLVEVSWPEELPYVARQKRFFSYEIVNDYGDEIPMP